MKFVYQSKTVQGLAVTTYVYVSNATQHRKCTTYAYYALNRNSHNTRLPHRTARRSKSIEILSFDTVNHAILIRELCLLDLPANIVNWIISFLTGQTRYCKFNSLIVYIMQQEALTYRYLANVNYMLLPVRMSSVCNVRAPYLAG